MGLELDSSETQETPGQTEPSAPLFISPQDLSVVKEMKLRASVAYKEAQLAELQKQNLLLKIYIKYSLTEKAEINEETGEVVYFNK